MEQAKWTVMIYFAGPNRLGDYMVYSLKEIKSVGSVDGKLNLLAEFDSEKVEQEQSTQTNPATPLRFNLRLNPEKPRESVFKNLVTSTVQPREPTCGDVSASVQQLADFIVWAVTYFPAEKYALILSGDGGGPTVPFLPSNSDPGNSFGPRDLAKVFNCVNDQLGFDLTIDVLGLDSCLMSMAEVAYEVRDYAAYFVSSQGNIDDMGWPYRDILADLRARIDDPCFGPKEFSQTIVDDYIGYYVDYGVIAKRSTHLSALRLDRFDHLARNVKSFTDAANDILPEIEQSEEGHCSDEDLGGLVKLFAALLVRAHWRSQSYRNDQYTDLFDFCQLLKADLEADSWLNLEPEDRAKLKRVARACDRIMKTLCSSDECSSDESDSLVVKSCYAGVENQYSHGLSLYFPWHRIVEGYFPYRDDEYSFAMITGWLEFLHRYLCATRRPERESRHESSKFFRPFFFEKDPPEGRDPPEGKGFCVCESTKNGPSSWSIPDCVPPTTVIE
jgi:hypothetical protein